MTNLLKALLFLPLLLLLTACPSDPEEPVEPAVTQKTVLVYQAAQNSLGDKRIHVQDSIEIMKGAVQYLKRGERVLLFTDDARHPRLYVINAGTLRPQLLKTWDKDENSASPELLQEVLTLTRTQYPSDTYGLVLWSHATGWLPGGKSVAEASATASSPAATLPLATQRRFLPQSFGVDVGPDGNMARDQAALGANPDEMSIEDLAAAINASGVHLRYILFDCCLMQCIESAYALRHVADYIAASPMSVPGAGGEYTDLIRSGLFSEDVTDIGKTYVEYYARLYASKKDDQGVVFSVVQTGRLQAVADALSAALPQMQRGSDGAVQYWTMTSTQAYAPYTRQYFYRPEFYDLSDALRRQLSAAEFAPVKAAIDAAVLYKGGTPTFWVGPGYYESLDLDTDHYCGISMFVPQQRYTDNAPYSIHGDLNTAFRQTEWYRAAGWQKAGW